MHGTIENAGRILTVLGSVQMDMGVTELAQHLGEPTSTVHDLLQSMATIGLLNALPNGRYELGWETVRLGYLKHWYVRGRLPIQRALYEWAHQHSLAAGFVILDHGKWILVDYAISPAVTAPHKLCHLPDLHSFWPTSAKVIWANRPWAEVEMAIVEHGLVPGINNTAGIIDAYRQELDNVRRLGYAYTESGPIQSMSTCVCHATCNAIGALMLYSKQGLFTGRIEEYSQLLMQSAEKLGKALSRMDDPLNSVFPPR